MATIPSSKVSVSAEAGALAGGTGYCVVFAAVSRNADVTPRVFSSFKAILAQHDYAPGVDYSAHHIESTRKPVIFVGLPIVTAGALGRQNASKVTGSSVIAVSAAASGYMEDTNAVLTVTNGGTIGTDDIRFTISFDADVTSKSIRLSTGTTYVVPYLGIVLTFGAGTLVAGDVLTFSTTAPRWDSAGIAAGRAALAAQQKTSRSWQVIGDVSTDTEASFVVTAVNAYETSKKRFTLARVSLRDRLPYAEMSRVTVRMTGTPTLTFAEVGATGDTVTRSTGSFVTDGFAAGMVITVAGSASNNVTGKITAVNATVLTLDTADLTAEGPVSSCTVVGSHGLTFAEVGGTGDTITRSGGSWLDDGFRAGDLITVTDSASNNITDAAVTAVTATVLTLGSTDLAAEVIGSRTVTVTAGETMAEWMSDLDAEFAPIAAQKRVSLGAGRLRKASPITGWEFWRPVHWAASVREYQHDIHRPTWTKEDGPLDGWKMTDADDNVVGYDEDTDGGGLAAGFTVARTWGNGPLGAYIAMDLTRDVEGSALQFVHNMNVANVACTVVQAATEMFIGRTPQVNADGTGTPAAIQVMEEAVNTDLEQALMREFVPGEGPRASLAVWRADPASVLKGVDATLIGAGDLRVNGTIVNVDTLMKVT